MGRPSGSRNQDYEATEEAIAAKVLEVIVRRGARVSFNELAREAGVSIPTLKHYFGDRSGVVAHALRSARKQGETYIAQVADPGKLGLSASLRKVAEDLARAWVPFGVGQLFVQGLAAGVFDETAGPGYLEGVLEPTLRAMEERFRVHARRGEARLDADDDLAVRTAALAFLSPLLMALIHQHALSGTTCRPLPVDRFTALHVDRFTDAYGVSKPGPGKQT